MPFVNAAQVQHPAFAASIERLRACGVTVLYGGDMPPPHPPGAGKHRWRGGRIDVRLQQVRPV